MKNRDAGFTLIEILFTMVIVSILLGLAIPSFASFTSRYRLTTTTNDFLSSLMLTRNEAIKRGHRVDMIPVNGDWRNGWVVFVDQNNDQLLNGAEEIIQQLGPMSSSMSVSKANAGSQSCTTANGTPFMHSGKMYIAYFGSGSSRLNSGGFLAGSMLFMNGAHQRCLIINAMGRTRIIGS